MSKRVTRRIRQSGNPAKHAAQQAKAAERELTPAELATTFANLAPYDLIGHYHDWSIYARRAATLSTREGREANAQSRLWRYAPGAVELKTETGWMTTADVVAGYRRIEQAIGDRWPPRVVQPWGSALERDDRLNLCLTADPSGTAGEWSESVLNFLEPLTMLEVFRLFCTHQLALSDAIGEPDREFAKFLVLGLTDLSPWEWFQMIHERAKILYPIL